jgi:hypothetical protein
MALEYVKSDDGTLKLGENGNPLVTDGQNDPFELDALHLYSKVPELNKENEKHRKRAKEAQEQLESLKSQFDGIDDPEKAREALKTVQNLDDKKLIDSNEVEKLKKSVADAYEKQLQEKDKSLQEKDGHIYKLLVSNQFANSKVVNDKTVLPPDMAEAYFGKHFKIEDGQVVGYIGEDKIYSREKPGEIAPFEEALQTIIDQYPMKDRILKAPPGGSGSPPGGGTPPGGGPGPSRDTAMSRQDFIKEQFANAR